MKPSILCGIIELLNFNFRNEKVSLGTLERALKNKNSKKDFVEAWKVYSRAPYPTSTIGEELSKCSVKLNLSKKVFVYYTLNDTKFYGPF